eukprot:scaffold633_cov66-Cyclotella_meneghiniana.AAC.1
MATIAQSRYTELVEHLYYLCSPTRFLLVKVTILFLEIHSYRFYAREIWYKPIIRSITLCLNGKKGVFKKV